MYTQYSTGTQNGLCFSSPAAQKSHFGHSAFSSFLIDDITQCGTGK